MSLTKKRIITNVSRQLHQYLFGCLHWYTTYYAPQREKHIDALSVRLVKNFKNTGGI